MDVKVLNINQITKDFVTEQLQNSDKLSKIEIDEYLDILSALNKKKHVYNIDTPQGEFILYITAKKSHIKFNNKKIK